jgi:hypothetical protein
MLPITDEHKFWDLTSAAEQMFAYLHEKIPKLTGTAARGFDRGNVSRDGSAAYAHLVWVGISWLFQRLRSQMEVGRSLTLWNVPRIESEKPGTRL